MYPEYSHLNDEDTWKQYVAVDQFDRRDAQYVALLAEVNAHFDIIYFRLFVLRWHRAMLEEPGCLGTRALFIYKLHVWNAHKPAVGGRYFMPSLCLTGNVLSVSEYSE